MSKLEVFFDYACPHCLRGHEYLMELLPQFPGIEVQWRPCEAHPRPEEYSRHSDLCARGMFFALEQGADLFEYHDSMYKTALIDKADIDDTNVVVKSLETLLDSAGLLEALSGGSYESELFENNRLVWDEYLCDAVPSYRMGGELLKSELGVGVMKEQLEAFMKEHS